MVGKEQSDHFDHLDTQEQKNTTSYELLVKKAKEGEAKNTAKESEEKNKKNGQHVEVHMFRRVTQAHWASLRGVKHFELKEERIMQHLCSRFNLNLADLRKAPTFKVGSAADYQKAMRDQVPIAKAYIDVLLKAPGLPLQALNYEKKRRVRSRFALLPYFN